MVKRLVRDPELLGRLRLARTLGVSPRRLNGWEPQRVQAGYDEQGHRCAVGVAWTVVVETEPEWTDDDREWLLALATYEAGVCECGFHRDLVRDPRVRFGFNVDECPNCAAKAQYLRLQASDDADIVKAHNLDKAPPLTPRPGDGRYVHLVPTELPGTPT